MATKPQDISAWFRMAMETNAAFWRTAISIQEQGLRWWSETMGIASGSAAWQRSLDDLVSQATVAMQKNAEFFVKAMDAHRQGLEMLTQTSGTAGRSADQPHQPVQQAWESTLSAMKRAPRLLSGRTPAR